MNHKHTNYFFDLKTLPFMARRYLVVIYFMRETADAFVKEGSINCKCKFMIFLSCFSDFPCEFCHLLYQF